LIASPSGKYKRPSESTFGSIFQISHPPLQSPDFRGTGSDSEEAMKTKRALSECKLLIQEFHGQICLDKNLVIYIGVFTTSCPQLKAIMNNCRINSCRMAREGHLKGGALSSPRDGVCHPEICVLSRQLKCCFRLYTTCLLYSLCLL
uniref:Uncharacterized protein n=1 Tax=Callithrix jacchus TaxID=9483 RepID=A0A5F4WGW8_CALJA